jgi:predicted permease
MVPLEGSDWNERIVVGGVLQDGSVKLNQIGPDFFRTLEMPLLAGRAFDSRDRIGAPLTAIVNETFARRYFNGRSPVGETFQTEATPDRPQPTYHIVGIVKDTKYIDLREEPAPIAYLALAQEPEPWTFVELVVRADVSLGAMTPALTRAIVEAAPGASVSYDTITQNVRDLLVTDRLMASLSGFFGVLALLIATVGLYGVMSYAVSRRQFEIGIRMALGAEPRSVVRMVIAESGALLAVGTVTGVLLAAIAGRWAASLLYGLEPWDPTSFALAVGALTTVSLLAAWIPARRAARLAPTIALRATT